MIAIDLGSNTLRLIRYDCENGEFSDPFERIVRTADGLENTGVISEASMERILSAFEEASGYFDFAHEEISAVCTEALRKASNANEVLSRIEEKTGVRFEIIDGAKEAKLTLIAVRRRLELISGYIESFLLVDIGGGSTELIFSKGEESLSGSFPVGIVTMAGKYSGLETLRENISAEMAGLKRFIDKNRNVFGDFDAFVATAGTPTTVAAMKCGLDYYGYDPEIVNGTALSIEDLDDALKLLLSLPPAERERLVGVGRSDLIAAGIVIFREIFVMSEKSECIVVDDGLREGVAIDFCSRKAAAA